MKLIKLFEAVKIVAVVVAVLVSFYLVLPKFQFFEHGRVRCNKITGKVEYWRDGSSGWVQLKENLPKMEMINGIRFMSDK